jgi:hypothetical protein
LNATTREIEIDANVELMHRGVTDGVGAFGVIGGLGALSGFKKTC